MSVPVRLRRFGIALLVIVFGLETALFALGLPQEYQPHTAFVQFQESLDRAIGYTNTRSTSIDFTYDGNPRGYFREGNVVQHVTNGSGFRGPEIFERPPNNKKERIAFLGDSVTFGEGVYFEDTYPEQFKVLAEQAGLFEKEIEPINFGVGGYNTTQEFNLLLDVVKSNVRPDRVIVGYNMNDAADAILTFTDSVPTRTPSDLEKFITSSREMPPLAKMSRIYSVVYYWFADRAVTQKTLNYYHDLYADESVSWQKTKEALRQFGEFQKKTGIPVTFVVFPRLFHLDHYPFKMEREKVRQELEINGLGSVFIYPYLHEYKGPELWVHPTDQHPNEIVHRIIAEALVDRLSKERTK